MGETANAAGGSNRVERSDRPKRPDDPAKRRYVVTGAASGMGKATVERLLRDGSQVLAVDINAEGLAPVAALGAETIAADLSTAEGRQPVIDAALAGPVDGLVNSAAIIMFKPIWDVTPADLRRILAVNSESVWFLCQAIGPKIRAGGAIVNFSSPSAKLASTVETAPYAMTKTIAAAITRSFAYALGPQDVRVNAISPGITETPMQDAVLREVSKMRGVSVDELAKSRMAIVPMRRSAPAGEIADAIEWLLNGATYLTGHVLDYDGGYITW